tara:strand:- start:1576 stop:2706 length:1131 start_codon:yes stop_codon:yes gene_type:complete
VSLEKIEAKKILVRFDFNVPMDGNKIINDFRIKQSLATIYKLLENNNKILIASHLGRPIEGQYDESLSLKPVCDYLSMIVDKKIKFFDRLPDKIDFEDYQISMLENVRFNIGEKKCNKELSKKISSYADCFVFDAFGVAHRRECTTYGVSKYLKTYPGLNIKHEIFTINKLIKENSRPMTIIISGAKVSTKLVVIKKLLKKCDYMILGGGILNTFLKAKGYEIGQSLFEEVLIDEAKSILQTDDAFKIIFPTDLTCEVNSKAKNIELTALSEKDIIYDIGNKSINHIKDIINKSSSIFWNGPLGYIEKKPYDKGTIELAKVIADHKCFSIVGGGDTLPIIENLNLQEQYSCLSTGGGSLLTYLEGGSLPIIKELNI